MRKNKDKKFSISKVAFVLIIILFLMSTASYYTCSYYANLENTKEEDVDKEKIAMLETGKDILLVIISVCGTNLILSVLLEVSSKNSLVSEIINNDVIASPEFYNNMSDDNKQKVYSALERKLFSEHSITTEMFYNIRKKINEIIDGYYFESCEYMITCDVFDRYIEKEITKRVTLKSYDENYIIKEFCIGNLSSKMIDGLETFKLLSFEINGESVDIKKYIKLMPGKISNMDEQNEYNVSKKCIYSEPIKISSKEPTVIVVKCMTRTTVDDKISTFRVTKPCKSFSLNYTINQSNKYRLVADAFGFLDDADDSTNSSAKSNINIKFKDWIFKYDGVVVSIVDKQVLK